MLSFERLREQNTSRLVRWHGDDDDWNLADWSNAMQSEAGEAGNKVKKIRRTETPGLWEKQTYPGDSDTAGEMVTLSAHNARQVLVSQLADELADTVCYADLLAHHAGIDLGAAVRSKFNRVSEAQGFPERL